MYAARHFLAQRHLALLICAAALLMKLLVPAGYMVDNDHGRVAITLCSGTGPVTSMTAMPGMHGNASDHGSPREHGKAEIPCAFSSLAAATLGAIDPVQLAALVAFVLAIGLADILLPPPSDPTRLRPPPRGPPAYR